MFGGYIIIKEGIKLFEWDDCCYLKVNVPKLEKGSTNLS